MKKVFWYVFLGIVTVIALGIAAGAIVFIRSPIHQVAIPTATGITAKQLCSLTFVSKLPSDRAYELYVRPLLGDVADRVEFSVGESYVSARFMGLYKQTAYYRDGLGCTLSHAANDFDTTLSVSNRTPFQPMAMDEDERSKWFSADDLDAALANAFQRDENTLAIVVLKNGRLMSEQYAAGISQKTPLPGWSMAKSVTATIAGVLQYRGVINLRDDVVLDCPETNLRGQTLGTLLSMTSGLNLIEQNSGSDPNSRMLWTRGDMACFAARQPSLTPPGEEFEYMSGNTVIAARFLQNKFGQTLEEQIKDIRATILAPMNIHSMIMEPDASGTIVGSSFVLATPQDWARLGQVYLDAGAANGQQIFAPDWVETVQATSDLSDNRYGLGFWVQAENLPVGAYEMEGFQRQSTVVIPEHQLVVVRQGATNRGSADMGPLIDDIIRSQLSTPPD